MKITLEFEHPWELTNLLKELGSSIKQDKTEYTTTSNVVNTSYDGLIAWECAYKILKEKGIL